MNTLLLWALLLPATLFGSVSDTLPPKQYGWLFTFDSCGHGIPSPLWEPIKGRSVSSPDSATSITRLVTLPVNPMWVSTPYNFVPMPLGVVAPSFRLPAKPTWRTWPTTSAPRYTVLRWQWFGGVAASFVSGGAWGFHEKTMHHWWVFAERFPNAEPEFWNPAISWLNKYKDRDVTKGRNNTPVPLTDAKHLLASTALAGGFVAGATFTIGEQRPWWHYGADLVAGAVAWRLGNWIAFDGLYR